MKYQIDLDVKVLDYKNLIVKLLMETLKLKAGSAILVIKSKKKPFFCLYQTCTFVLRKKIAPEIGYLERNLSTPGLQLKILRSAAYPGLPQMSKMEDFTTIIYGENFLTVVVKRSILDVFGSPEYNSVGIKPFHATGLLWRRYGKISGMINGLNKPGGELLHLVKK